MPSTSSPPPPPLSTAPPPPSPSTLLALKPPSHPSRPSLASPLSPSTPAPSIHASCTPSLARSIRSPSSTSTTVPWSPVMLSQHWLKPNPALSSLSLHSTTYFLFISQDPRNLFLSSSSHLHTLNLSGLPFFISGMLARCSSLKLLTLKGRGEARESVFPNEALQQPSLESLVALLVHVEARGGGSGMITRARNTRGEFALSTIRHVVIEVPAAISLCICVRLSVDEVNARIAREEALLEACDSAETAGQFTAALDEEREEKHRENDREGGSEEGGGGGRGVEELVGFIPENDMSADLAKLSETLLGEQTGIWPAIVAVSRGEARALLHALTQQLVAHMEAIAAGVPPGAPPLLNGATAAPAAGAVAPGLATAVGAGAAAEGARTAAGVATTGAGSLGEDASVVGRAANDEQL
ncbi:unnamed protein product [Closterium sp. Yama58-4]|nr:unnamed protein product [Closterium sp. Yama58-4]